MIRLTAFTLCLIILSQCKSQSYTPYDFKGPSITIATGGGYTGQLRSYCLLANGQLFFGSNREGFVKELEPLSRKEVDQIFNNYDKLGFADLEIDRPGNMYHYLIYKKGSQEHKIQWGAYDAETPRELTIFFANLKKQFTQRNSQNSLTDH